MKRRISLGLIGSALLLSVMACGTAPEPTTTLCNEFRVGADLTSEKFGVTGLSARPYAALAQAVSDIAGVASGMLRDVGGACQSMALELGASADDARLKDKIEPERSGVWCEIAADRFERVRSRLDDAHFTLRVDPPICAPAISDLENCEQSCKADPSCVEAAANDRCPTESRQGLCTGTCTGTCVFSEDAPGECKGTCEGLCYGTCGEGKDADDCSTGCTCSKSCDGVCTAGCKLDDGGARCDALCVGGCSEPLVGQSCATDLAAPRCEGDADCQNSCKASAAARAVCGQGSLVVVVDEKFLADAETARLVGALERNLPPIFLAARGRAKALADGASDLIDGAGHILARPQDLGPKAAACGMVIGQTASTASKNLKIALNGSKRVTHAVTGDALNLEVEDEPGSP